MALLSWLRQQSSQVLHGTPFNPLLSLLPLFIFLYAYLHTRRGKANLPPSPPKLPIIGNLHQLGTLPHRSLQALSRKYGPLMFIYMGHVPTLVVSSADMAREMLKTHDIIFSNRPHSVAAKDLLYECTDVGFVPYGEYWRQVRKLCALELFSHKSVQSFQHVREEEVEALIKKIRNSCLKGASVHLSEMLLATSNNIVSRCVCGHKFEGEDGKSRFGHVSRKVMVLFTAFCFGDLFPSLWWMDVLTGLSQNLKATHRELDTLFDQVIEEHKRAKTQDDESSKKDFTDILLKFQKNGMLDIELTQKDLKATILDMFVGGSDSTSTALQWLMAELLKNPKAMKRVQEEVRRVVGKKLKIEMDDINQMSYLRCVIKETLRLHPPAPLLVPRETSAGLKFGGYDIPPRTRVFVNTWAIQRDPNVWERPEEFLPERFEGNPIDYKGQDYEFLPFGGGRRGCPGFIFATASIEYVIANIIFWFDWKLPSDSAHEDLDMSEVNGLTVTKKFPLHLVPILHTP